MEMFLLLIVPLMSVCVSGEYTTAGNTERHFIKIKERKCYPDQDLGCFYAGGEFYSRLFRPLSVFPDDPKEIKTRFLLHTRKNRDHSIELRHDDENNVTTNFNSKNPTKFICHGFMQKYRPGTGWMTTIKDELLKSGDFNVILVDWSSSNLFPYYRATANTQVVGAQIDRLVRALQKKTGLKNEDVHIIGHSLGSHIAGYAGARMKTLGRITGLDPAGPNFKVMMPVVRLDETDAKFVDVIHSDASLFGFGTITLSGHLDFMPNNGVKQPGCNYEMTKLEDLATRLNCNHERSIQLFVESINSEVCRFKSVHCKNWKTYLAGNCTCQKAEDCASMGFHADAYIPHLKGRENVKFYLKTNSNSPYCLK